MYGYVVNIESAQPLKRLSITEVGFDKIVENNMVKHKLNYEGNSNEYTFSLNPIPAVNTNANPLQNPLQNLPMIMSQPPQAGPPPQPILLQNQIQQGEDPAIIYDNNGVSNYPKQQWDANGSNTNVTKNNRVAPYPGPLNPFDDDPKAPDNPNGNFEVLWHDLSYTILISLRTIKNTLLYGDVMALKNVIRRRVILKNLNGFFRSGEVTAILGPSGAGKSTLLEIICGRRKFGVDGQVRFRGADENGIKLGFVPQDNYLLELMTVREAFLFASKIINVKEHNFDHKGLADKMLRRFGLDSCADTRAKRCSGGQRKRLSIALEVISAPNILVLDEPTTGLDSPSCTHIMTIMKELASDKRRPTAVLATIHQPSVHVFNGFDNVYVLSTQGKCVYHGTPQNLVPTFISLGIQVSPYTSPAEYVIEIANGDFGPEPTKRMVTAAEGYEMERLRTAGTKPLSTASRLTSHPFWPHLITLYIRSQRLIYRDPFLTILRIFFAIFAAISLAIMFGPDVGKVSGCVPRELELYGTPIHELSKKFEHDLDMIMQNVCLLFLGIMIGFISGITPTLLNFPREMQVFHKEYHNGWYSCITYYTAKVISDIPLQIITPLIYIMLTYFYSHQPLEIMRFSLLTLVSVILSLLAQSIGECASAAFMEDQNWAVVVGGLIPLPMILFGGFMIKISRMPWYLRPISWFSFLRYAFEAMMISTYGFNRCEYTYQQFLSTVNVSAITKPLWAEAMPLMMEYVRNKRNGGRPTKPMTDEDSLKRLYEVFGGGIVKDGKVDLNKSLILNFFELEDYHIYIALAILTFYMVALKVFTYFVLLAKLHQPK